MISTEEWKELDSLRREINNNPASVCPSDMERFTELFVKSIQEVKKTGVISK